MTSAKRDQSIAAEAIAPFVVSGVEEVLMLESPKLLGGAAPDCFCVRVA